MGGWGECESLGGKSELFIAPKLPHLGMPSKHTDRTSPWKGNPDLFFPSFLFCATVQDIYTQGWRQKSAVPTLLKSLK